MLARITPGRGSFDVRTYVCPACYFARQLAVELVDPMKSADTLAWFQGELQAPT
jgi:hypothetical protein